MKKVLKYIILILIIIILIFAAVYFFFCRWITDWIWLKNAGFSAVIAKVFMLQALSFVIPVILSFIILFCWFYIFRQIKKSLILNILICALSILNGVYGLLNRDLLMVNPFIQTASYSDPFFRLSAYFYMSLLPLVKVIVLMASLLVSFIMFFDIIYYHRKKKTLVKDGKIHFHFSTMLLFLITAFVWLFYFFLSLLENLVSQPSPKLGISYSSFYGLLLGAIIWIGICIAAIFFLIIKSFKGIRFRVLLFSAGIIVTLYFGLTGLYPIIMENFFVKPNELMLQKPFIKNRIEATRNAFALNFTPLYYPDYENPAKGFETVVNSLRIWDTDPYKKVIDQMQTLKTYFDFADVDVDAYPFETSPSRTNLTQVVLSARELNISNLSPEAMNWDNIHLRYTHGHGAVLSPSHLVDKEGSPVYWLGGLDQSPVFSNLALDFPQIYFGEMTGHYIIIHTKADEFEYTTETNRITNRYLLERGVPVGNLLNKLLYSMSFKEKNILLSQYLTKDSRIIYYRNILERVKMIFPYLEYDPDPYPVILNGKLIWIIDAYTTSRRFPLAERFDTSFGRINYIRNSVKVTVDAYTGDAAYYIIDKSDPIAETYRTLFPGVFQTDFPAGIEAHFRYPYNLMKIQSAVLCRYHTDNEDSFYNGDNVWEIPRQIYGDKVTNFEPFYMLSSFETNKTGILSNISTHFSVVEPFTPRGRENLSGWIVGYYSQGLKISLYYPDISFASFGPMQIESKINQDDRMSSFFTLWSQKGSKIFKGYVKFIPIGRDIFYIKPIFLESEQMSMPQLVKIVAIYNGAVYIGNNYSELIQSMTNRNISNK